MEILKYVLIGVYIYSLFSIIIVAMMQSKDDGWNGWSNDRFFFKQFLWKK